MKVVHIITSLRAEGAQMMLYKLLSRIRRERFDSVVISLTDEGALADKFAEINVPVHPIRMRAGFPSPAALLRFARLIRASNPDLIQGWMVHGNLAAQLATSFAKKRAPVLWNIRGSHFDLKAEKRATAAAIWMGAKLSSRPAKIINNSMASALGHEQRLGYPADKRVIIANGFDTTSFAPSQLARVSLRKELQVPADALLIGLIARFHPMKDHANFFEAASRLLRTHRDVRFVLAGKGIDDKNDDLRRLIPRFGVSSHTHLLGERRDVARLAAAMDIMTLSSSSEGFPNVIGEAMACGVPCAVTDVGDAAGLVGDTGQVVPPRDAGALADAWRQLIDLGVERRRALGQMARQRVSDKFSLDGIVAQYEALYESVLLDSSQQQQSHLDDHSFSGSRSSGSPASR